MSAQSPESKDVAAQPSTLHDELVSDHLHRQIRSSVTKNGAWRDQVLAVLDSRLSERMMANALRPTGAPRVDEQIAQMFQYCIRSPEVRREHFRNSIDSAIVGLDEAVAALPAPPADSKQEVPKSPGIMALDVEDLPAESAHHREGLTQKDEQLFNVLERVPSSLLKTDRFTAAYEALDRNAQELHKRIGSLTFFYLPQLINHCLSDGEHARAAGLARAVLESGLDEQQKVSAFLPLPVTSLAGDRGTFDKRALQAFMRTVLQSELSSASKDRIFRQWIEAAINVRSGASAAALYVQLLACVPGHAARRAHGIDEAMRARLMASLQATAGGPEWMTCIRAMEAAPDHPCLQSLPALFEDLSNGKRGPVAIRMGDQMGDHSAESLNKGLCAVDIDEENPGFLRCVSDVPIDGLDARLLDDKAGGRRYEYRRIPVDFLRPMDPSSALENASHIIGSRLEALPISVRRDLQRCLKLQSYMENGQERFVVMLDMSAMPAESWKACMVDSDHGKRLRKEVADVFSEMELAVRPPADALQLFDEIANAQSIWVLRSSSEVPGAA